MANAYGTEKYKCYVKDYLSELTFEKKYEEELTFNNSLKAKLNFYESSFTENGCLCHAAKTEITITDSSGAEHVYECIDAFMYPCVFKRNGVEYLIFRKTLYGYTILNLRDFTEIDYFPSTVIDGNEAFIMCEAKLFGDMLVLFGCFWAGPYMCYALDLETLCAVDLSGALGMEDVADNGISVADGVLTLVDGNTDKKYSVRYEELEALLATSGKTDL